MISSFPLNCSAEPDVDCQRGENAKHLMVLFIGPIICMFFLIIFCMISIYRKVKKQEENMEGYRTSSITLSSNIQNMRRQSFSSPRQQGGGGGSFARSRNQRAAMIQCSFYVSAFLLVWAPAIVFNIVSVRIGERSRELRYVAATLVPLQLRLLNQGCIFSYAYGMR